MINKMLNYIRDNKLKIFLTNNSVNIVNYEKILDISDEIINIMNNNKIIKINGHNLKLNKLLDNEVLITGHINKIEL